MVLVTLLNVMVAVALPLWTQQIQRDKEEELIFRGLQYAEAIRLFQEKVGRYPVRLEELLEIEPRSIRQLWGDPMNDDGKWGLVFAQGTQGGQGAANISGQTLAGSGLSSRLNDNDDDDDDDLSRNRRRERSRRGETVTTGPISGVHSLSEDTSIKLFLGATTYNAWVFTPDIIPIAPTAPGELVPSLNSRWVGRPFPEGVEPTGGSGIEDAFDEEDAEEERGSRRKRRDRGTDRKSRRDSGG